MAIPSSGIHSNGFSLIRSILINKKITKKMKATLLTPTKIYTSEILSLTKRDLIKSASHITGGGLVENISRSIPQNVGLNLDLSKIKVLNIFKWIKKHNISDSEMLKTFNCGVGFCLIAKKNKIINIKKFFPKNYKPYEIGIVTNQKNKINLLNTIKW